jgi:glycosyltransferase involved in cell wall biosynthesis
MNIVFVIPYTELGGAERQAVYLAEELRDKFEAQISFICFGNKAGKLTELLDNLDFKYKIIDIGYRKNFIAFIFNLILYLPKFILTVRRLKPDVLMPFTYRANIYVGILRKILKVRICIWNQRDAGLWAKYNALSRLAVGNTDLFIANSQSGADFLTDIFKVPKDRTKVILNGIKVIHPLVSREDWRHEHGFSDDDFLVCMIANLHENKDHTTLLYAWSLVVANHPKSKLLLAGRDGGTRERLTQLAKELKIEDSVCFQGMVDDVNSLLHAMDLSVLSSVSEGTSNSILESMAAGLPVIGTDIPSIRCLLCRDECLFGSGQPNELAQRMSGMMDSEEKRREIGLSNKNTIEQRFSVEKMANAYHTEIQSLYDNR